MFRERKMDPQIIQEKLDQSRLGDDFTWDIRNKLQLSECVVGKFNGVVHDYQFRNKDQDIGQSFQSKLNRLPIIPGGLMKQIQDYRSKWTMGEVRF